MSRHEGVLIFTEIDNSGIHKISYEILSKGLEICEKTKSKLYCLVLGDEDIDLKELNYHGADKVFYIKGDCFRYPEEVIYKENIVSFIKEFMPKTILIGATNFGRSLAPRLAAALNTGLTADCTDITINQEGNLVQVRPAFSNNILANIKTLTSPQIATVRYKEFKEAKRDINKKIDIEIMEPYVNVYEGTSITKVFNEMNFDISDAEVIVSGGRGLKKKEDLILLQKLADLLGGRVGVSRALVDSGMASSAYQIGYSGNRVKPKVYIACGISGAPQHVAGMKDSEIIIAINKDPSAPIFNISDYGYVGDLYQVIPKLIEKIKVR